MSGHFNEEDGAKRADDRYLPNGSEHEPWVLPHMRRQVCGGDCHQGRLPCRTPTACAANDEPRTPDWFLIAVLLASIATVLIPLIMLGRML